MKSYTHYTLEERICLQELLGKGLSFRKIAEILGRNVSSVSREVNRNKAKYPTHKKSKNKYRYHAWRATNLYIRRRREHLHFRLKPHTKEWDYITEKLKLFWSPEEICNRWKLEYPEEKGFSVSTVYRYIYSEEFPDISRKNNLRRRGKRLMPRSSSYNSIQPERIIPNWSEEIRHRLRLGDWEGDTIYGAVGKGLLVSMVDRKTRYLKLCYIPTRNAAITRKAIELMLETFPVNSISLDNGSEFSEFKQLEQNLNTIVYFAEPHKPWQRGTNENTNDIVRFFFPKGTNFSLVSAAEIQKVEDLINNRPRKCLGWQTAAEVFLKNCVALA